MTSALIVGCADRVWRDVEEAQKLATFDKIYCVKLAGVHWKERFDYWITLHPEYMDDYEKQRHELGYPNGYEIVAPLVCELGDHGTKGTVHRRVSYRYPEMSSSASSGIYGAKVALGDGHSRVVLAGIPMSNENHFSRGRPWTQKGCFVAGFEKSIPHMRGRVKSMSGMTREILGAPDKDWMDDTPRGDLLA